MLCINSRINELEEISKPYFGGAKGDQFEAKCDKIEKMFAGALLDVTGVSNTILDVQAPSWYDDILAFRIVIKDIEVRENSVAIPSSPRMVIYFSATISQVLTSVADLECFVSLSALKYTAEKKQAV